MKRLPTHPKEAYQLDKDSTAALHCLTFVNFSLWAIKAVYEAFPGALYDVDLNGNIPLNIAMECASREVIDFLCDLQKYPKALIQKKETKNESL